MQCALAGNSALLLRTVGSLQSGPVDSPPAMAFQRRRHFEAILPLIWLSRIALAQDDENRILYPDAANLTFHYKDTIDVSFATNYETPWMYLYCRDSAGSRQGTTEPVFYNTQVLTCATRNHLLQPKRRKR